MSTCLDYDPTIFLTYRQVFTVADARRTLEDILAQEAADQATKQEEALEHCRTQPPPVEPHSRTESYESEEEVKPEATPYSALAHTKMFPKPIASAQSESTSLRHTGIQIRWLRWGFCLILAIFLFLLAVDFISILYEVPFQRSQHPLLHGARDHTTRTFIYHTAFPQHITSRRDILHDFSPSSGPPSSAHIDVESMRLWSCSGSGSLHLDPFTRHFPSETLRHHDVIPDVLYCPNFSEPDHISAAQVGTGGSGLRFQEVKPGHRLFDEKNPVVPYVTLTSAHGDYRAVIDDQSRVTFTAHVRAPQSRLSRLFTWGKHLVGEPFKWYVGGLAALDDHGPDSE